VTIRTQNATLLERETQLTPLTCGPEFSGVPLTNKWLIDKESPPNFLRLSLVLSITKSVTRTPFGRKPQPNDRSTQIVAKENWQFSKVSFKPKFSANLVSVIIRSFAPNSVSLGAQN
jgi:hypothetical protein